MHKQHIHTAFLYQTTCGYRGLELALALHGHGGRIELRWHTIYDVR